MGKNRFEDLNWGDADDEPRDPALDVLAQLTWAEAMRASIRVRVP